jgi:hypothetical protein
VDDDETTYLTKLKTMALLTYIVGKRSEVLERCQGEVVIVLTLHERLRKWTRYFFGRPHPLWKGKFLLHFMKIQKSKSLKL